jgi:WD40 repeat protein
VPCNGLGSPLLTIHQSGRCILTIDQHAEPVTTVAWAPDGESFVTASLDKHTQLCLWSVNGRSLYNWALDYRIQHCAISPDGQRLVTISVERQIFVYNFVTREEQYSILVKSDMTSLSISRDSRYMLINMTENEVHMIDIETADIVRKFVGQKQGKFVIRSAFGGADENLVVSGSEGKFFCSCHSLEPLLIPPGRFQSVYLAQRKRHVDRNPRRP